jgi:hypothetical protein
VEPAIFITYSSKDEKVARTICTALENRGLGCWISSRNVKPGQNFQEQIVKAIRAAKIMVLVFTANANNSNEIKKELALASQNNLVVIPVRIQDVPPNEAFAYEFATRQWIDLFGDWESSIARLVELIAAAIHDHHAGDPAKPGPGSTGVAAPAAEQRQKFPKKKAMLAGAIAIACLAVVVVATFAYLKVIRQSAPQATSLAQPAPAVPKLASAPDTRPAAPPMPTAPRVAAEPDKRQSAALVPETIPFISRRSRETIRTDYMSAPDHKALAISTGPFGLITGQDDDESAKTGALEVCRQRADALAQPPKCELYALGNTVVYAQGRPPMPPTPWFTRDPSIEVPVVISDIPLLPESSKTVLEKYYPRGRKPKTLAISSSGSYAYNTNQENADEAVRRALEACGFHAGLPCRIIALDDNFVVPIPMTMKVVGLFQPASANAVAPELRDDLAYRIGNVPGGWTAVAASVNGRVGVMLRAKGEQEAIDGSLADCAKQDRSCHVIAIGPFAVEPK